MELPLNKDDYIKILTHYNQDIPKTKNGNVDLRKTKKKVRNLLASKLCRCIKKVQKSSKLPEPTALAICNTSIFKKRNMKHYKFTCKKIKTLKNKKQSRHFLTKTADKIKLLKKTMKNKK